jgi:phosphatidylinositol alpha-mannosyltransferase
MAAERPIVATRIEGYEELLADAGTARLAAVDDPSALANEITSLLEAPALCRILGARGRLFAANYDWDTIARRLESIYLNAVSGSETSGQNEYGSCGLNASDASERFERPLTR